MVKEDKSERRAFRMGPSDADMLRALADAANESESTVVRALIRKEYRATFGDKKPKSPKK